MLSAAELTRHAAKGTKTMPPECWGHPGWLTPTELASLDALRTRSLAELFAASDEHLKRLGDRGLLRFLRARKFDEREAFRMLQLDLEWRRALELRQVRAGEVAAVVDFCRNGFLYRSGRDKDGRPVLTLKFKHAFPRNIKDTNEIVLFWVAYVQRLTEECELGGHTDFSVIADLEGFSPSVNFSLAMVKILINILQSHYPERLGFLLLINLPAAFRMGWGLIQPFLDERTKAKIHVLGKDMRLLQEYIPVNELDSEYGGSRAHPYAKVDAYVHELLESGIQIKTGFFPGSTTPATPSASSSSMVRLKSFISSSPTAFNKLNEAVPKAHPRVAVFGATGRTGVEVVKRFLEMTDYDVVAFVRREGQGAPPALLKLLQEAQDHRLSLVVGDCLNFNDLDRCIEMCDAVVMCVGASTHLKSGGEEFDFYERTARAVVDSMQRNGTSRLVAVTAAQAKRMSVAWWDKNASLAENGARHLYWAGHFKYVAEMEKFIVQNTADVDYTFVRPSQLLDDAAVTSVEYAAQQDDFFLAGPPMPRPALAKCIVDECVLKHRYSRGAVAVAGVDQ